MYGNFHNHILDLDHGDVNWKWIWKQSEYSLVNANDDLEYCFSYFSHGEHWNDDLMHSLYTEKSSNEKCSRPNKTSL